MDREVRFWLLNQGAKEAPGTGRVVNMSSSGVLFTSPNLVPPGRSMELSISWPAQLNAKCGLRLVARGLVVRCEDGKIAVRIRQYEFRTESAGSTSPTHRGC
jgi:hypothetical protein